MLDVPEPETTENGFGPNTDYYIQIVLKSMGSTKIDP